MAHEPTISQEPIDDVERQRRFEAALGGYFDALEAGQSLDRRDLLARHPDLPAELAEFFAAQDRLHRLVAYRRPEPADKGEIPARPPAEATDPHPTHRGQANDPPTEAGSRDQAETQAPPSAETRNSRST